MHLRTSKYQANPLVLDIPIGEGMCFITNLHLSALTLCMLGNFACYFVICGFFFLFFLIIFFKKIFQEYHQSVKQFESRSGIHFVGPDLGPNCLKRLSADDKSRH